MTTCREIMTLRPVCCFVSDQVDTVAELMRAHNIGAVPVVEDPISMQLIGIVTDRDLALRVVGPSLDIEKTQVGHVMTPNPWSSLTTDDVDDVLAIMAEHQVRRVPIVGETGQLVGIIAQADVATRLYNPTQTAAVVKEISQPA